VLDALKACACRRRLGILYLTNGTLQHTFPLPCQQKSSSFTLSMLELFGIAILATLFLLAAFGLIGPKPLRDRVRRVNTWLFKDAELFLPIDPYKPLPEALREGAAHFWPTKERVRNWLLLNGLIVCFAIVGIIVSVIIFATAAVLRAH